MIFYDTNAILLLGEKVLEEKFAISSTTLLELEQIKTSKTKDEETKYKARKILHVLDENQEMYHVEFVTDKVLTLIETLGLENTPDNQICACAAVMSDVEFVTNDLSCKMIAKHIFMLKVSSVSENNEEQYKGYQEIPLDEESMAYFYEHLYENTLDLLINQYALLKDAEGNIVDKVKWTGEEYKQIRCKPYKSKMFGQLKPLDDIQACAIDSINSNDITVLYGRAGSGKTTLPLNYVMQEIESGRISKCFFIYSYEPLKGAKVLGFEKGDHTQKILQSASIGNILSSKFGDIDQVEYMINRGTIDIIPTANIRGVEFPADSCVIVTESQNLDVYTIKTIIQRCKEGCKQIYEGDVIEQKDTNIQKSGMTRIIEVFKGNGKFGCVKLKNNYRSKLSELADMM